MNIVAETIKAINDLQVSPIDGCLHFKNNSEYGYITLDCLMQRIFSIHVKDSDKLKTFDSIDDLIEAGWTID